MTETALLWGAIAILGAVVGTCFMVILSHIKDCRSTAASLARIEGKADSIESELASNRRWRDEAFPKRMDGIMSDFYSDISGVKRDIEKLRERRD